MALVTVTDFIREILTFQKLNGRFNVLKNFVNEQCVHQDEVATDVVGNKLIKRAANGTAKVAAPVEEDDVARKAEVDAVKAEVDAHANSPSPHSGHVVMATGEYTGNGGGYRTITVGFAPQYVHIFSTGPVGDVMQEEEYRIVRNGRGVYLLKQYEIEAPNYLLKSRSEVYVNGADVLTDNGVALDRMNKYNRFYSWVAFG